MFKFKRHLKATTRGCASSKTATSRVAACPEAQKTSKLGSLYPKKQPKGRNIAVPVLFPDGFLGFNPFLGNISNFMSIV